MSVNQKCNTWHCCWPNRNGFSYPVFCKKRTILSFAEVQEQTNIIFYSDLVIFRLSKMIWTSLEKFVFYFFLFKVKKSLKASFPQVSAIRKIFYKRPLKTGVRNLRILALERIKPPSFHFKINCKSQIPSNPIRYFKSIETATAKSERSLKYIYILFLPFLFLPKSSSYHKNISRNLQLGILQNPIEGTTTLIAYLPAPPAGPHPIYSIPAERISKGSTENPARFGGTTSHADGTSVKNLVHWPPPRD